MTRRAISIPGFLVLMLAGGPCAPRNEHSLTVTATAYNSLAEQTAGDPTRTAWGDTLRPGMKAIAVSRDLIPLGLSHGARVRIDGLRGEYRVLDKMGPRWKRRIDIYMGDDLEAARAWGERKVRIRWKTKSSSLVHE